MISFAPAVQHAYAPASADPWRGWGAKTPKWSFSLLRAGVNLVNVDKNILAESIIHAEKFWILPSGGHDPCLLATGMISIDLNSQTESDSKRELEVKFKSFHIYYISQNYTETSIKTHAVSY